MDTEQEAPTTISAFAIEAASQEIDAGSEMTLRGQVACSPPEDLRGRTIQIRDGDGSVLAEGGLAGFDGTANQADALVLRAPDKLGDYTWSAVLVTPVEGDHLREEVATTFSFTVKPHETNIAVWDVPSAIVAGECFAVKIGVKCTSACLAANWRAEIADHNGTVLAVTSLSDGPWRGTTALRHADVELEAPREPGLYRWRATAPGADLPQPHTPGSLEFAVRVVPAPEVLLRVEAFDSESKAPVRGAKVVVHPYRAFTDEHGVAQVRLPKGDYTIIISGKKHIPYRVSASVTEDMTQRAELDLNVGLTHADLWS